MRARTGRISVQVLEEYYVTVASKLDPGLDPAEARSDVRSLSAWRPLPLDDDLLEGAWEIEDRRDFAFRDALIVAAARDPAFMADMLDTTEAFETADDDGLR